MKRRRLLALGVVAVTVSAAGLLRGSLRQGVSTISRRLVARPVLDRSAPTGQPTDRELLTLLALGRLVLPSTAGETGQQFVLDRVRRQSASVPGMLAAYRSAVRLLDATGAPTPFHARSAADQQATLLGLFPHYSARDRWRRGRTSLFASHEVLAARTLVLADLLGAYYRSPAGWAVVRYTHFPGTSAADPLAYTRPPGGLPE